MRGLARRACAGVLALWFLAGGVAHAAGAHHCPHHDALPSGEEAASAHPGAQPPAAVHSAGHAAPENPAAPAGDHGPCTCVGQCHAGSVPGLPATPDPSTAAAGNVDPSTASVPSPPARRALVPFALPWGNAPPVS